MASPSFDGEVDVVKSPGVLIAHDHFAVRRLVRATIEPDGYAVLEAADGDEAWDLIRRHRPVLALLDLQMPGRDGLDLTRAIKADAELAGTQVIMVTAQQEARAAALAAGVDLFLLKPFSPIELRRTVRVMLHGVAELGRGPTERQRFRPV